MGSTVEQHPVGKFVQQSFGEAPCVSLSKTTQHIVKEQFVPTEHRDIASFNVDNEFNLATDEENIDFNIPGVPNSTVKRSHGVNVHNLI